MSKKPKNLTTIFLVAATLVLGSLAVLTALKLYQAGQEPVAPTAPSQPRAIVPACRLEFTLGGQPTPTLTTTPQPTNTPRPTATNTPQPTSTPEPTATTLPTATRVPTSVPTNTPAVSAGDLPETSFSLPTLGLIIGAVLFTLVGLLL